MCTCVRVCTRLCAHMRCSSVRGVPACMCPVCLRMCLVRVCALVYTRACVCPRPHSCHPTRRRARRRQIGTDSAPDSCFPRPRPLWAPAPLSLPPLSPQLLPTSAELSVADPRTEPRSEGPHPRPYSPGQVPPRQASSSLSSPGGLRTQRTNQRALESVPSSPRPRWPLSPPVRVGHCEMGAGEPPPAGGSGWVPGSPAQCQVIASARQARLQSCPCPLGAAGAGGLAGGPGALRCAAKAI